MPTHQGSLNKLPVTVLLSLTLTNHLLPVISLVAVPRDVQWLKFNSRFCVLAAHVPKITFFSFGVKWEPHI